MSDQEDRNMHCAMFRDLENWCRDQLTYVHRLDAMKDGLELALKLIERARSVKDARESIAIGIRAAIETHEKQRAEWHERWDPKNRNLREDEWRRAYEKSLKSTAGNTA